MNLMNGTDEVTRNAREMYDTYRVGHYSYGKKRESYDPFLMEFLTQVPRQGMVYDVGCGSGFWLDVYVAQGIPATNIVGVDLSEQNIRDIQSRGYQGVCDNVLNLKINDHVSDVTISNGVIHHTSNPYQAFQQLVRITKKGGLIYLAVYNAFNPYYYIVHKATYPLRFWYWNKDKKILDKVYPLAKGLIQFFSWIFFREFLDEATAKTIFMDQVMTPRADFFTPSTIKAWCVKNNCRVEKIKYIKKFLMIGAIIKVG